MKLCKSKTITIYDYRDIDLSQYVEPFSMSDEELAEKLDKVRTRHAAMAEAETVERDDFVTLDTVSDLPKFRKTGITVRVGKGLYSLELEEAILGMKAGEERTVTIPEGDVKVTVRTVRRRVLPPLDDETVAAWGLEGVETVAQLTAQIKSEAKTQYVSDMAEALAVEVSGAANDRSTFDLDADEIRETEAEGQTMAEDMLRSAGLDPDTATDEEVMAVSGRTKAEHYDFLRTLCRQELRSVAIGAELMEREGVEIPDGAYDEAVQQCADGMGITRQEAEKVITYPKFLRQFAANYYFEQIIDHVTGYLNKEEEQ